MSREKEQHAKDLKAKARESLAESKHVHEQTVRLDAAHLLAEVALVLCSITLLTKKKVFWYVGLATAVVSIALTFSAYTIPNEPHREPHSEVPGRS
jgi:hypothetical protein